MKSFVVAKMFVINDAGELLVLRRSKTDERRPGQLDFPGGWVEDGEDLLAAAKRETMEEAGLQVADCKLVFALTDNGTPYGSGTWLTFLTRVSGRPTVTLSHEHDDYQWMPFDTAAGQFQYERQRRMLEYVRDNDLLED